MDSRKLLSSSFVTALFALASCGDSGSSTFAHYQIVSADSTALQAHVGDAYHLSVVEELSDGTTKPLASDAQVTWSGPPVVVALPEGSTPDSSILPQPGPAATAMWIENPDHLTPAQVAGVLYVLDPGTDAAPSIAVQAAVAGGSEPAGTASATVSIAPFPTPDPARGHTLYTANCGTCHGASGEGGVAPGLNDEPDNVAGDPTWTPQMMGITARSNMDNLGVSLAASMPKWLLIDGASGQPLTTQNFSDIYAFLKTQMVVGAASP
jgi:mono/diheme cytochrome c family protein